MDASDPFLAAEAICRRHAKSFFFASVFLPKPKRQAAYAVYAFCRMIDDAVDAPDPATAGIDALSARLDEIYSGRLDLPQSDLRSESQHALQAVALTVEHYEIPKRYFLDLAEGCRMDLTIHRYATWQSLETYCYHVAGVVGLIMSRIFGLSHSEADRQAIAMGNAMQLTNILRDVREDWLLGRIYLPQEDMDRFGYTQGDLACATVNDAFRELMKFEVARARQLFRDGAAGLCWLANDGSRLTAAVMATLYSGILGAIERQRYDVFSRRARINTMQKIYRLPGAWRLCRRRHSQPLPPVFG